MDAMRAKERAALQQDVALLMSPTYALFFFRNRSWQLSVDLLNANKPLCSSSHFFDGGRSGLGIGCKYIGYRGTQDNARRHAAPVKLLRACSLRTCCLWTQLSCTTSGMSCPRRAAVQAE